MSAMAFDTHEFYTDMVNSGLPEKTADALIKAVAKIEKAKLDELATKRDLADTKADLTRTILTVGVGVGLAQLVAIFLLFMLLWMNTCKIAKTQAKNPKRLL